MRKQLAGPVARTCAFFWFQMAPAAVSTLGLSLWLADRGVSASLIGVVNAAPLVASVGLALSVGKVADRVGNLRGVIVACCLIAAVTSVALALTRSQ